MISKDVFIIKSKICRSKFECKIEIKTDNKNTVPGIIVDVNKDLTTKSLKDLLLFIEIWENSPITTNKTIFYFNETAYVPFDFADSTTEPNATGVLNQTVICLAGDD